MNYASSWKDTSDGLQAHDRGGHSLGEAYRWDGCGMDCKPQLNRKNTHFSNFGIRI